MQNEYRDIVGHGGLKLKALIKEKGAPVWLIVTHGLGEHMDRHQHFLKLFAGQFNILLYDLRGHGRSEGERVNVHEFADFRRDLQAMVEYLKLEFSMKRFMVFGHSMGGLITADWVQNEAREDLYPEKIFLSSPPVGAPGILGPLFGNAPQFLLRGLADFPLTLPLGGILDLSRLSHDSRVLQNYLNDEYVELKVHTHLFFQLLKTSRDVFSRPLRARCPIYASVGSEDGLVNAKMLVRYFTDVEKNTKLLQVPGGYHELHNEVEKYRTPYFNFLRESLLAPLA
ncbi:MAG: alpha/beta fold hydrolase [Bacteriovoracia bacterium]